MTYTIVVKNPFQYMEGRGKGKDYTKFAALFLMVSESASF